MEQVLQIRQQLVVQPLGPQHAPVILLALQKSHQVICQDLCCFQQIEAPVLTGKRQIGVIHQTVDEHRSGSNSYVKGTPGGEQGQISRG